MIRWCPAGIFRVGELVGGIAAKLTVRRVRKIRGAEWVPARLQILVLTAALTSEVLDA